MSQAWPQVQCNAEAGVSRGPLLRPLRMSTADLSQVQPTEYRADGVVTLTCPTDGSTAVSIVVEIQRQVEERKRYTWPAYLTTLRARLECPVFLLVLSHDEATATWHTATIRTFVEPPLLPALRGKLLSTSTTIRPFSI